MIENPNRLRIVIDQYINLKIWQNQEAIRMVLDGEVYPK